MTVIGFIGGHGGSADGAKSEGLREADLALLVSTLAVFHFDHPGMLPALLRDTDREMDFVERNASAIANNCDLVVSIHFDANPNHKLRGCSTYTWPTNQRAEKVAIDIGKAMPEELRTNRHHRTSRADWTRRAHRVLRAYSAPAVLVECATLTNEDDRTYLRQHGALGEIAQAICLGCSRATEHLRISP